MVSLLQITSLFLLVFLSSRGRCSSRKFDIGTKNVKSDYYLSSNASFFFPGFDPSKSIQLSWHPRVFLYEGFLTDEECDHLLSLANGKPDKPFVTENSTGDASKSTTAASAHDVFAVARGLDEVVLRIEERISTWAFLPEENGEDMQIFHYRVDGDSKQRYQYDHNRLEDVISAPPFATILIFLSNVSRGGEIIFPKSKINASNTKNGGEMWSECTPLSFQVKHVKRNALLIFNLHLNATVDESSLHSACSVLEGEKWSATKLIHVRAFENKKKRPPDSFEECTDEDDNCRHWAAMGECQKNAVYMLGTPDYYGSCRKSCGVC